MKQSAYWQKLQDPRWQKKRLEVFERDGFTCRSCNSSTDTLQVHHLYYVSKRDPWDYPLGAFKTLCLDCHEKFTTGEYSENWESFVNAENEADLNAGGSSFTHSLCKFAEKIEWPESEVLLLITEAMDEGIITAKTLGKWRLDLRRVFQQYHKEAELLMKGQP